MATQYYKLTRGQHVRRESGKHVFYSADKNPFIWLNEREAEKLKGRVVKVRAPAVTAEKPDMPQISPDMFDELEEVADEEQPSTMKITYTDGGPVGIETDDTPLVKPLEDTDKPVAAAPVETAPTADKRAQAAQRPRHKGRR
jgi:hypothetical protein